MVRCYGKTVAFAAALIALSAACCGAFQLLAPTEGEAVRESVKIVVPASTVPDSGFVAVLVGEPGAEKFVVALSRDSAKAVGNDLVFYWNSKAPYYDPTAKDPMKPLYFKDGRYPFKVQVHDAKGVNVESASANIEIKNRVPRTNPAPGVALVNSLSFGQLNEYRVHCDVSIFEMVNRIGLPKFGGMALSADGVVIQTVEDARPDKEFLLRLRQDERTYISSYGVKQYIYAGDELKPQLYRLTDSHGKVIKGNMFAKQAKYQIMDMLPVLPTQPVKEGDSWPDSMTLKIDGLTPLIKLKGSAMLDSFEWQNGRECAKITSMLSGDTPIVLAGGKIQGAGPVNAEVTTYFAYKTGKMLQRNIRFTFDAAIAGTDDNSGGQPDANQPEMSSSPYGDEQDPTMAGLGGRANGGSRRSAPAALRANKAATDNGGKKGKVEFDIVVRLEK